MNFHSRNVQYYFKILFSSHENNCFDFVSIWTELSFLKIEKSIRCLQNCYVMILVTLFETVDQDVILVETSVKNVNIDELALVIEKVVCDLNEYDLLQLTKTFNLLSNNLENKGKRHLKKIIERCCEGILDEDDISDDVKKPEVTHNEGKSTTASTDQQEQHGVSRTSSVIAAADVSGVEGNNQLNFFRQLGLLNPLRKDLIR